MVKTNTPFLSFGASGSVGESITAQKRGLATLVRAKPLPADPYSLPQAYQRWYYQDVAYRWKKQSEATKAEYRAAGVRFHLTGFQYWMKAQLPLYTDIAAWWTLDEKGGAVAYDRTPNANHGTIRGASPTEGLIDGAQGFDGLNDDIYIPSSPTLQLTGDTTWEFFIYRIAALYSYIIEKDAKHEFMFRLAAGADTSILMRHGNGTAWDDCHFNLANLILDEWIHYVFVRTQSPKVVKMYRQGVLVQTLGYAKTITASNFPIFIGEVDGTAWPLSAKLDNMIIFGRALDSTEAERHSGRRYPAQ